MRHGAAAWGSGKRGGVGREEAGGEVRAVVARARSRSPLYFLWLENYPAKKWFCLYFFLRTRAIV
jgi:hypothetical protein